MKRNPYYTGPVSDHFDGVRFFNPGGIAPRGFRDLLKWQFDGQRQRWPATVPAAISQPEAQQQDLRVTMIGHATLLIQTAGMNILTDPVWSDRASPVRFAGPRRVTGPGIRFDDLPRIDLVLLSHNHYDHLDLMTLRRLHQAHAPVILTPLGNDTIIRRAVPGAEIITGDWGDSHRAGPLQIHFEPCHHWSARGSGDRSMALWAAFVLAGPSGKILHIGDTGFDNGRPYRDLPARHGPLRLAILPIGAYEPRWFMQGQHQNPDEAVRGLALSGAAHAVGHHWGVFQLTNEAHNAPPEALEAARQKHQIAEGRFRALTPGETWDIPKG
jgi:L-ascorbate metabolism protein UlaG (beta-lactamase superfamily)